MLKQAVVQNLVPEEKRRQMEGEAERGSGIKFTTDLPELQSDSNYEDLIKRVEVLEKAVKGLIELVASGHEISDLTDPGH